MKAVVAGLGAVLVVCGVLGGFAAWLLNQAEAQGMGAVKMAEQTQDDMKRLDAGLRGDMQLIRKDFEERNRRIEDKLDKVLEKLDRRR